MNWMIEGLPETVEVNGAEVPVKTGFRAFMLIDRIMRDEQLTQEDRLREAADIFYKDGVPDDFDEAVKKLLWFQHCGEDQGDSEKENSEKENRNSSAAASNLKRKTGRALDLDRDCGYIYAAFLETYGIDLTDRGVDLHWWKFHILLECLPGECHLKKIMYYRTADLSGLGKGQKKFILKMRSIYALEKPDKKGAEENRKKLAKRNRSMLDYINARYRETGTGTRR